MMENSEYLDRLKKRGIKPTSLRVLILRTMMHENRAVSILDIESELETVDKSTIFRTVTLFLSHHLIHSIDDGSGSLKYAVCGNSCTCAVEDLHSHFYCNSCHKTYCLEGIDVPVVELPVGFSLQSINYVLKGICFVCSSKNKS